MTTHHRESATPTDLLDDEPNGYVVGDCSCGVAYRVLAGPGEGDRLDAAQTEHERSAVDRP